MTRITQRALTTATLQNLQRSLGRTSDLQEQLSTGRVLNRPSDSPTGIVTAMQTRASLARNRAHAASADDARTWLNVSDSTLQGASTMLGRVRDLVVQGQNSSVGPVGRENIAREIESIRDGLLELANTRVGGRLLFAGTADPAAAFDAAGVFQGDGNPVERTVADGLQLRVDVDGVAAFGSGPGSVFGLLTDIADALRTTPDTVATTHLGAVDGARDRILAALGDIGARSNRLDAIAERNAAAQLTLRTQLSEVEDVDLPQTIMELQLQEVAYQAALSATSRVIQPSLMDFLR